MSLCPRLTFDSLFITALVVVVVVLVVVVVVRRKSAADFSGALHFFSGQTHVVLGDDQNKVLKIGAGFTELNFGSY